MSSGCFLSVCRHIVFCCHFSQLNSTSCVSLLSDCGYASIENLQQNTLADSMPSFFLSETCKYLFLLFDEVIE